MGQTITKDLKATDFSQDFTAALFADAGSPTTGAYAALVVNPTGARNTFKLTAVDKGTGGNDITLTIDKASIGDPTTVEVATKDITVHARVDGSNDYVAPASEVCHAITAYAAARALVHTSFIDESGSSANSTTPVDAVGKTNLTGGLTSDAYKAWAKVGTVSPGSVPVKYALDVKEAFPAVDDTDLNKLKLYAHQAAGTGAARWYGDAVFEEVQPLAGGALSSARAMAGRVLEWLGGGEAVDTDHFVAASTTMKTSAYTIANAAVPGPRPRHVTLLVTKVGAALDTLGSAVIVGTADDGSDLTETLALVEGQNISVHKFSTIVSITTADWVRDAGGGSEDTIECGFAAETPDPVLPADIYAILEGVSDDSVATLVDANSAGRVVVTVQCD